MSKWKKAISAALTATMLASLFTVIAASTAFAAITVTSAGNVPVGGTSANNVGFTFTEATAASLANSAGSFTVVLGPAGVTFTGTPSVAGSTGSLGAGASISGNTLTVTIAGSDTANIESIIVSGLKLKAATGTAPGAITATITGFSGQFASAAAVAAAFSGGVTANGTLSTGYSAGTTNVIVNVTGTTCLFQVTAGAVGNLSFATSPETKAVTAASALGVPGPGQQTLTIAATANNHQLGEAVSQSGGGCAASVTLASPGTVVASLTFTGVDNATVFPGEFNSPASNLTVLEPSAGFLPAASTLSFHIATPGVVFSSAPSVIDSDATMVLSAPVISADRTTATVTVTTASAAAALITLQGILYDVGATVPSGTFVTVGLTTSGGLAVNPATVTNAVVFRGVAASATSPTVYIGENNQTAGIVTFTESSAGFFTAGVGTGVNTFQICPSGVTFTFTTAPFAQVVGGVAAGNLILRDGNAASTTNLVMGTNLGNGCYGWTVWTASTTASSIKIGGAGLTAGALINVTALQAPGGVNVVLKLGSANFVNLTTAATVQFAVATYRNQVSVTALSQPAIGAGSNHAAAGNIQIAETGLGQLKAGEFICVEVLPRTFDNLDVYLNGRNTADLPIATASGTGLVIGPVSGTAAGCTPTSNGTVPVGYTRSVSFEVLQQSTAGDGKVVISNISYTTLADAVAGPVQLSVWGLSQTTTPSTQIFHSTVSNARISSNAIAGNAATRLGVTQVGAFTTSTKVAKVGKYVTYRFDFGVANAGAHVDIWGAKKTGNDWSAFTKITARVANASGVVYYYIRQNSATWRSYRATVTGSGTLTPARQARWIP